MSDLRRFCFSCDLKEDSQLIKEYKEYHAQGNAWPEITKSITDAGIIDLQIYISGNRMFMIMDVDPSFDPVKKSKMDAANTKVQEWEDLMWKYQQALPWAKEGEKWVGMEKIFQLGW
ncbi:L-rhamnose mutarotase [Maribacter algarum]|uniref:L-rhamnose mutarotase n=1 Tax=Maribacter algarum (ex Zhang et al. 2020) TaxID=2578118 RepID=A0A5S3PPU6_9FLAO|nr:L-rhamnose mutarotase [Maribacter algarum]TMM56766.1 L-rhamnose mutarotase [Maribacter algarum]